ncbi:hypothetical protein ACX80Z_11560 [Arthrobacter sp. TMT4-20]
MDTYRDLNDAYGKQVTVIALAASVALFGMSLSGCLGSGHRRHMSRDMGDS